MTQLPKIDFFNRHTDPLPEIACNMKVITKDFQGEHISLCAWHPFNKNEYKASNMPGDDYLGTAKVLEGEFSGIGFHAWRQNDAEFVYYQPILYS